ncbi:unnamed protein product [Cuscuta epithymum]|uniref:Reverse transcriptase zinc-binding domain-containing protein n=1 Tax=Cuscuta epithymum TaxID=186058 RepID=A0AAV0DFQ2_9ASTE|nr:unnamed protein product [Cuscuta epithymum]
MVCCGFLPTMENLRGKRVDCAVSCGLCGAAEESPMHLFVRFSEAMKAWSAVGWRWSRALAGSFLEQVEAEFRAKNKEDLCKLIWGCWGFWCEHNNRVWNGGRVEARAILQKAAAFVAGWEKVQQSGGAPTASVWGGASVWRRPVVGRVKLNVDATVRSVKQLLRSGVDSTERGGRAF